jgi:alcohol dehydrogenase class IV
MLNYSFQTTPRILIEQGAAARLGEWAVELGMRRPVIITDAGLLKCGLLAPVLSDLEKKGCTPLVFSDVLPDPPEERVLQAVEFARSHRTDGIVGLGGGSSMDTAKLVALLLRTPQDIASVYGIGLARGPRLPLIQIPTTAGTGSEVTPIAIVTTPSQEKKGVVSPILYADLAILDVNLTLGLPPAPTAMTGVDAMVHAIEAFTSRRLKNPLSDSLALQALALMHGHIGRAVKDGSDVPARAAMLQGSLMAGMAFANAPVAAVHALAYPIGGHYHVPHGLSNALVLVPVLQFNAPAAEEMYARLATAILPGKTFANSREACQAFIDAMASLVGEMPFAHRLRDVGIEESALDLLADDAIKITRLLVNNPREMTRDDILAIYRRVW